MNTDLHFVLPTTSLLKTYNHHRLFRATLSVFAALTTYAAPHLAFAQGKPDIVWMRGGDSYPEYVSLSADGKTVATTSYNSVKLRDVDTGKLIRTFSMPNGLTGRAVALSPDGRYLYCSGNGSTDGINSVAVGYLYRLSDGTIVWQGNSLVGATFSPDGKFIGDRTWGVVLRTSDGSPVIPYIGAPNGPGSFSADSTTFVSARNGSNDPNFTTFSFFDLASSTARAWDYTLPNAYRTAGLGTALSPDKTTIAAALWNQSDVGLYLLSAVGQARGSQPIARLTIPTYGLSTYLDTHNPLFWNAAGLFVPILEQRSTPNGTQNIYSALRYTAAPKPTLIYRLVDYTDGGPYSGFAMTPDGSRLATAGYASKRSDGSAMPARGRVRVYDTINNQLLYVMDKEQGGYITGISASTDGKTVASGSSDGTIALWNRADGSLLRFLDAGASLGSVDISPDGTMLVSGSGNYFDGGVGYLKMWRVSDGTLVYSQTSANGPVVAIQFSPDGTQFAATIGEYGNYGVRLYRTSDGVLLRSFGNDPYYAPYDVKFSPDGKMLATAGNGGSRIWRVADGAQVCAFGASGSYDTAVAFSPDGATIAYGYGNDVRLASATTGAVIRTSSAHTANIASLAFAPDGKTLLSASHDATLRFWKVSDGTLLQTYDNETASARFANEGVRDVAFTPNGEFFSYGRADSTVVTAKNPFYVPPAQTVVSPVSLPRPAITKSGANLLVTVNLKNTGGDVSYYTRITGATMNGQSAVGVAPSWSFTLPSGASRAVTLTFPGTAAARGSRPFVVMNYESQNARTGSQSVRCDTAP